MDRYFEFRLPDLRQSNRVLQQLAEVRQVVHYEIIRPSLHDIFVRIARPETSPSPDLVTNSP
jgi:ABC-type uncharacterized transport system ATPase subunit